MERDANGGQVKKNKKKKMGRGMKEILGFIIPHIFAANLLKKDCLWTNNLGCNPLASSM